MILIREEFIAKPGMASKLAKLMKEVTAITHGSVKVMTDFTGEFNHVVIESEFENFAAFEERMKGYGSNPEVAKKMAGYSEMYQSGRREIYRII